MNKNPFFIFCLTLSSGFLITNSAIAENRPWVPGTGTAVGGDDFEHEGWKFYHPPARGNRVNKGGTPQQGIPQGHTVHGNGFSTDYRDAPNDVFRVITPAGGLPGSKGSLQMSTVHSGEQGRPSFAFKARTTDPKKLAAEPPFEQDDFHIAGRTINVENYPSVVTRVYIPPFEEFEQRMGSQFGWRANVISTDLSKGRRKSHPTEPFWPGFFLQYDPKAKTSWWVLRCDANGQLVRGPDVKKGGWWTLGMSFTPDHQVHYFAKPGVNNLTGNDHLVSLQPYANLGLETKAVTHMFYNVLSPDDGVTKSTNWIVDDPTIYMGQANAFESMPQSTSRRRR